MQAAILSPPPADKCMHPDSIQHGEA